MRRIKQFWDKLCAYFQIKWNVLPRMTDTRLSRHMKVGASGKRIRDTLCRLEDFLRAHFEFRFNELTEETEFRYRVEGRISGGFKPVTQRNLNTICLSAQKEGIDCWDRDVSRHIYSEEVEGYHPFRLYLEELPAWDGEDRLEALARRVSDGEVWIKYFRRWMLAMVAGWLDKDELHANSVVPVLVSLRQGRQKSTFCKLLLPEALRNYYTDSYDLTAQSAAERKLAEFGLINLDELDKFSSRKMALLKNLVQMAGLNIRKAHQKNFRPLPRIASFIATSNQKELLVDPSGSRRFLCVEVMDKIDCSPLEHDQVYAQLKAELGNGACYWFTSDEEAEIMAHNTAFYKAPVEADVFYSCFRLPVGDEACQVLPAADIFQRLKKHNPSVMRSVSAMGFGRVLISLGVERIHTYLGNHYRVVRLS